LFPKEELEGSYLQSRDSKSFLSWKMTRFEVLENFTTDEIGPWQIPQKLTEELEKIKQIVNQGPESVIEFARRLGSQTGENSNLAYEIVTLVRQIHGTQEAISQIKNWEKDVDFCESRLKLDDMVNCTGFQDSGVINLSIEEITMFNLMSGIFPTVFDVSPANKKEVWGKYFWLFSLKKAGVIVLQKSITEAGKDLSKAELEILEKWRDYSERIPYEFAPG
jgi:hypothetical protein